MSHSIHFTCDADHAVHFDRDYHYILGHLQLFSIGSDVTLLKDLNVVEPEAQASVAVAGLITDVEWGGSPEDPLTLKALVSGTNRQKIMNVMHKDVADTSVTVKFAVWDYDNEAHEWFKTLSTMDATISGSIATGYQQEEPPKADEEAEEEEEPEPEGEAARKEWRKEKERRRKEQDNRRKEFEKRLMEWKQKAGERRKQARLGLVLGVNSEVSSQDTSPFLYEMNVTIDPGKTVQSIHLLTSYTQKIVKDWGVAPT